MSHFLNVNLKLTLATMKAQFINIIHIADSWTKQKKECCLYLNWRVLKRIRQPTIHDLPVWVFETVLSEQANYCDKTDNLAKHLTTSLIFMKNEKMSKQT